MPVLQPTEMHAAFVAAFNSWDLDALVELYEPDAALVAGPGVTATGHAALREAFAGFLAMQPRMQLDTLLVVQTGDLALAGGQWSLVGTDPEGGSVRLEGKSSEVLRRQPDGSWRYVIDNPFA